MTILLITSLFVAIIPVVIVTWRRGELPESISAMVFVFKYKWLWTLWMWAVSFLTCIPAISALNRIGMAFLGFGTLVCLLFCAVMPIWMEDKKTWHDVFGISACVLSQMCVMMICPGWLLLWFIMVIMVLSAFAGFNDNDEVPRVCDGKAIFLAQSICYISLVASLFTHGV